MSDPCNETFEDAEISFKNESDDIEKSENGIS